MKQQANRMQKNSARRWKSSSNRDSSISSGVTRSSQYQRSIRRDSAFTLCLCVRVCVTRWKICKTNRIYSFQWTVCFSRKMKE